MLPSAGLEGGVANIAKKKPTQNIQQVSEKLEKGQKLTELELIKINEKQFTKERPSPKEKKSERQQIVGLGSLMWEKKC